MSHRDRDRRHNRRGGGGGGGSSSPDIEILASKKLSYLLRHGAEREGLKLGPGGYVNVADVLSTRHLRPLKLTLPTLSSLVATNAKQRFSLIPDPSLPAAAVDPSNPAHHLIRANQGHSITIPDLAALLAPLPTSPKPRHPVVHGTSRRRWALVRASGGLKRMGRTHVHFARGLPPGWRRGGVESAAGEERGDEGSKDVADEVQMLSVDDAGSAAPRPEAAENDALVEATAAAAAAAPSPEVISGMRLDSEIAIFVDVQAAAERFGLREWWVSENGVVLCDGGEDGVVPTGCFERVEDRAGRVIWRPGDDMPLGDGSGGLLQVEEGTARGRGRGKGKGKGRGKPGLVAERDGDAGDF